MLFTFFDVCRCEGNCKICSDNHIWAGVRLLKLTENDKGFMRLRFEKITGNSKLPSKGKQTGCVWYLLSFSALSGSTGCYSHWNLRPLFGWCLCDYGGGVYFSVPADRACIADTWCLAKRRPQLLLSAPRHTLMALFKIQRHTCFEIWLSSYSLHL